MDVGVSRHVDLEVATRAGDGDPLALRVPEAEGAVIQDVASEVEPDSLEGEGGTVGEVDGSSDVVEAVG